MRPFSAAIDRDGIKFDTSTCEVRVKFRFAGFQHLYVYSKVKVFQLILFKLRLLSVMSSSVFVFSVHKQLESWKTELSLFL